MFKHDIKAAQDRSFDDILHANTDDVLMDVTQHRLLGVIRQLGDLCLHASAIFEKLSLDVRSACNKSCVCLVWMEDIVIESLRF